MNEVNLRDYLPRVPAPPDFEARVLAAVADRKKKRREFFFLVRSPWRWSLAAAASLVVVILVFNFILFPRWGKTQEGAAVYPGFSASSAVSSSALVLTEPIDFREEFSGLEGPKVIYILEPVNDRFSQEVRY